MKSTTKLTKRVLAGLVLFLAFAVVSQAAADGLTLAGATFFGGAGDQRGTGVAVASGSAYLSGTTGNFDEGLVVKYSLPPASPLWSDIWPEVWGPDYFLGVAVSSEGVYAAGASFSQTDDFVGDKEFKGVLAKYPLGGTTPTWVAKPNIFAYRGNESFNAAATSVEGGFTFIYAVGNGEPCSYGKFMMAKFDTSGNLIARATEPGNEPNFTVLCAVFQTGFSIGFAVTVFNSSVYVVGDSVLVDEDGVGRPDLMKYDSALNRLWKRRPSDIAGSFHGVTGFEGALYAVGNSFTPSNSEDFLIQKYDEAGNLVWSRTSGGPNADVLTGVVAVGSRLFTVGYTKSQGSGGADAVILEIDPATGNTLSMTLFGGAQDDMANGVATDGSDLYVVGESKSFASNAGNAVGRNDVMLLRYTLTPLRYTLTPPARTVDIDIKPGSFPNSINPRSQGKIPVAILTTDTFDATTVDPSTVLFGASGTEAAPVHSALEDVDGDGDIDMIFHFHTQDTGIACGATSGSVTGETVSGQAIEGSDSVKTVGCK